MKKIVSAILVFLMLVSLAACGGQTFVWNDVILGDKLPEPPTNQGKIHTNSSEDLWINVDNLSDKQFYDYVEACKEKGFTIDAESNSSSYEAYNAEGYQVRLSHYGSNADMSLHLEAPMEMTTITWPTSIAGNMLPTPKSTTGKFSYEYEDHFFVYVGNMTKADYAEYVTACSEKGFHVDYSKGDDYYYADNSEGWHISVRYQGNHVMSIEISAPEEEETTPATEIATTPVIEPVTEPATEATTPTTQAPKDDNGIDPEFKAAMDSYEKFFDEYVVFMKKFKANPNDLTLITQYGKYMAQYTDMMMKFEKWGNEDLNPAETAYYLQVQTRITQKLLEVA